jgi:hypothetical protein
VDKTGLRPFSKTGSRFLKSTRGANNNMMAKNENTIKGKKIQIHLPMTSIPSLTANIIIMGNITARKLIGVSGSETIWINSVKFLMTRAPR